MIVCPLPCFGHMSAQTQTFAACHPLRHSKSVWQLHAHALLHLHVHNQDACCMAAVARTECVLMRRVLVAVEGMPAASESMDQESSCGALVRCGGSVRVTVLVLSNSK